MKTGIGARAVAAALVGLSLLGAPKLAFADLKDPEFELMHPTAAKAAEAKPDRRIKYCRNPVGLPDISPAPNRKSTEIDYIPVYAVEFSEATEQA